MQLTIQKFDQSQQIWDEFVTKNNDWSLFQSFTWGQLQSQLHQKVERFAVCAGEKMIGVMQLVIVNARRGKFVHLRHGPVLVKEYEFNIQVWKHIFQFLRDYARQEKAWFVRLSPMLAEEPKLTSLFASEKLRLSPIHRMDAEVCWVLDMQKTEDELFAGMRKTTRYLVRHADKLGVEVTQTRGVKNFMKLYRQTSVRHGFVPHLGIKEEFELFNKQNQAVLLEASFQNEVLAAAIILFHGKQAIYHHGASISSKVPASYLLQWEAIKLAKKRGMSRYNFWGIAGAENARHPWHGITLFKQGFGGVEKRFLHARDLPLSPFYWISYTIETGRRIARGYK